MPVCDFHIHTRLSPDAPQDADNTVMSCCENALERGIRSIAFTEHCDITTAEGAVNGDLSSSKQECLDASERFSGCLGIAFGVELAHAHVFRDEAEDVIKKYNPDFVLGSLHLLRDGTDFYSMNFSRLSDERVAELYLAYLDELYEIALTCDFDSLAHCAYPIRYYRKAGRASVITEELTGTAYDRLFDVLVRRGKALEINCAGNGETVPSPSLVRRYISRGGRLFTLGSDSHERSCVGKNIDGAQKMLRDFGIGEVCVFSGRERSFIKI